MRAAVGMGFFAWLGFIAIACAASAPSAAAATIEDTKAAVPDAAARDTALRALRSHFAAEYADSTAAGKAALAQSMLTMAEALTDDPVNRFVLLDQARTLAVQAAHVERTFAAIDALAGSYAIDARDQRFDAVIQLLPKADAEFTTIADIAFACADECMKVGDDSGANKIANALAERLKTTNDESLRPRMRDLRTAVNLRLKVKAWKRQLDAKPDDPTANFELGAYTCFVLGDFRHGFPLLAKGSDAKVAELARIELDDPQSPDTQFDLAEKWFKAADSIRDDLREPALLRAATWFRTAQPRLTGLKQQLALDRLAKLGATVEPSTTTPTPPAETPRREDASAATPRTKPFSTPAKYANRKRAASLPMVEPALGWLRRHQSGLGSWSGESYVERCTDERCANLGSAQHDVGLTGLALLAFLGAGHTPTGGPYADVLSNGLKYLLDHQDPASGCFGSSTRPHDFLYDHAIATMAVTEAYALTGAAELEQPVRNAVRFIESARNPESAWRYTVPPNSDNDVSITGWMLLALRGAQDVGISIDQDAIVDATAYIDSMTDEKTWRTGYITKGGYSAREAGMAERWSPERTEAMTAAAMLCRIVTGANPSKSPALKGGAELVRAQLPAWDNADFYYWYYGSQVMFQLGERDWQRWEAKLSAAIRSHQETSGCAAGSWDPSVDPWGHQGSRVYATAILCLCVEAPYRSTRIFR
ncbi:MAG: terpene cyclase/mutase family protein [Planctomycetes bacterium]|nr:terpene cyclase/mutase family protein [Planctomycetota bacterium]MCC7171574.1 terpene cyclase/mutase family protein [Planctomycetota bacterium]